MAKPPKETQEQRRVRRLSAYERGWVDSLGAFQNCESQPWDDKYDYMAGWNACAKYRWGDLANKGVAPDLSFRPERTIDG